MRVFLSILLTLIISNAFAQTQAISAGDADGFEALSFQAGTWQSDGKQNFLQDGYKTVHYVAATDESVVFSFYDQDDGDTVFAVACKADKSAPWRDCSPAEGQIPAGNYQDNSQFAHDGKGSFMIVGSADKGALIAACRNAAGQWSNCSPSLDTQSFYAGTAGYGNGTWMVLSGDMPDWDGQYNLTRGYCMSTSRIWTQCDATVEDPDDLSMLTFQALEYLPNEQRWVAVGMGYEQDEDVFKSYCRSTSGARWKDCTGGFFLSNGTNRLVKNDQGHLLQLNSIVEVEFNPRRISGHRTQVLCRVPNGVWSECGSGISEQNMKFYIFSGASVADNGEWIVAGCQVPDDYESGMPMNNVAHLTATRTGSVWQVDKQTPDDPTACIADIFTVKANY